MVTAMDQGSLIASTGFTLAIQNVNDAPTVASPLADQTVQEDAAFTIQMPATTFADQDAGDTLTLSASLANGTALPSWLNFNAATATFSGTPDDAQVGSLDLRVTATDGENLNVSDVFTLTVANMNEAPTVAVSLANQTAVEDAAFTFAVPGSTFADVDSGDELTYNATLADGTALPTWLSFNSTTRTFSGTPVNSNVGTPALRMTSTDTGNLSASDTFSLTVTNVNDAPTVANPIVDQTAHTGAAFTFTVPTNIFADVDLGDTLTYNATLADGGTLPAWLSFNSTTRTFNGTPSSGDTGLVNIKVTATDAGSLRSDLFDLTVTIQDQVLTGTAGSDVLAGGAGNDQLFGLAGNDTLQGGAGNDLLDGGTGTDTMLGGIGNDIYIVNVAGDVVTELGNEGTDTVQSSITSTLGANVENLTLTGTVNLNGTGNALDNVLTGNSGVNVLIGGAGNDTYVVDATGDVVTENVNEGMDTVQSSVTYMLAANVENLTLTGTAAINGTGNALDNILAGNSAANTLTGGTGNDIYLVSMGDTVVEQANQGLDTVQSGVTWTLGANLEALTLTGTSNINGTGNALNNLLTGNSGATCSPVAPATMCMSSTWAIRSSKPSTPGRTPY
jgi:Ca2+-binding RTX toxin-like protein